MVEKTLKKESFKRTMKAMKQKAKFTQAG